VTAAVIPWPPASKAAGSATPPLPSSSAADNRQLSRVVGRYGRLELLLLDELGYVQLDPRGAGLLFQIITEREKRASIAIGTNLPFSKAHLFARTCARWRLKMHGFA
jgi:DNA replication protein DnaC